MCVFHNGHLPEGFFATSTRLTRNFRYTPAICPTKNVNVHQKYCKRTHPPLLPWYVLRVLQQCKKRTRYPFSPSTVVNDRHTTHAEISRRISNAAMIDDSTQHPQVTVFLHPQRLADTDHMTAKQKRHITHKRAQTMHGRARSRLYPAEEKSTGRHP